MIDPARLDMLAIHSEKMDSDLIEKIDRFRVFTKADRPKVAVLCSEKILFNAMQQLFTEYDCADITVYGTFDEEDIAYDVMLSDAVIAVTSALKTAPVGICNILEKISKISKEIYVMIGCWESMPKDPKLAEKKASSIPDAFPHSKIAAVRNYFRMSADGFILPDAAAQEMLKFITNDFSRLHSEQEEKLYQWLKKYVAEYHSSQRTKIYNELSAISGLYRIATAKQDEYRIRVSHIALSVQSVLDAIEKSLSQISVSEIEYGGDDSENLYELVIQDKREAELVAKRRLAEKIITELRGIDLLSDATVIDKGRALNADCTNDFTNMYVKLQKMEFVSKQFIEEFGSFVENNAFIEDIAVQYNSLMTKVIETMNEKIKPLVFGYVYTMKPGMATTAIYKGKKLIRRDKSEGEFSDEDIRDDMELPEDCDLSDHEKDAIMKVIRQKIGTTQKGSDDEYDYNEELYRTFMEDTELMLTTSIARASMMVADIATDIKRKIDAEAYDKVRSSFADIFKIIAKIEAQLQNEKETYNM